MGLVLAAALAMGGVSMWLLFKESKRLESISESSLREQAASVVADTSLIVGDTKAGVMEALSSFDEGSLHNLLLPWVSQNSLVEFAFSHEGNGSDNISYYPADIDLWIQPLLREEGEWLWGVERGLDVDASKGEGDARLSDSRYNDNSLNQRTQIRKENLSSKKIAQVFQSTIEETEDRLLVEALEGGNLALLENVESEFEERWQWVEKDGVARWIGYVRYGSGRIAGASVNLADMKNRFAEAFPSNKKVRPIEYVLRDADGVEVASNYLGNSRTANLYGASFSIPMDRELVGWTLVAYPMKRDLFSSAFLLVTGLLIALLVIVLLFGGLWLGLQSRRSQLDAARRSSFVSNVSHELKTPLTTIRMYSELLEVGRIESEEKRKRYLSTIASESQRLSRLVNNVLDFSRLEHGKAKLAWEALDLSEVLDSLVEMKREELKAAAIELDWERSNHLVRAMGDNDGVMQIVSNLIDNAIKYASEGQWIGLEVEELNDWVALRVSDRGKGIPSSKVKALFEPFERGDDTLAAAQSGCGLGLSIARGLAAEMKGELSYVALKNGGACFVLKLRKDIG